MLVPLALPGVASDEGYEAAADASNKGDIIIIFSVLKIIRWMVFDGHRRVDGRGQYVLGPSSPRGV